MTLDVIVRTVTVTCLEGYRLSNGHTVKQVTCNGDGSWAVINDCKGKFWVQFLSVSKLYLTLYLGRKTISRIAARRLIVLHPKQNIENELKWQNLLDFVVHKTSV